MGVYNQMVDHLRDERARLQEQHHFLAQMLEQSPSAIVVLDFDGAISLCNPAAQRLLDAATAELTGRRLADLPVAGTLAHALRALAPGETGSCPCPMAAASSAAAGPSSTGASPAASS